MSWNFRKTTINRRLTAESELHSELEIDAGDDDNEESEGSKKHCRLDRPTRDDCENVMDDSRLTANVEDGENHINCDPFATVGVINRPAAAAELDSIELVETIDDERRAISQTFVRMQHKAARLMDEALGRVTYIAPSAEHEEESDDEPMDTDLADDQTVSQQQFDHILEALSS